MFFVSKEVLEKRTPSSQARVRLFWHAQMYVNNMSNEF
jgi:hypothetical protein